MSDDENDTIVRDDLSRRGMLGIGSTLAAFTLGGVAADAQQRTNTPTAGRGRSASDPGPENKPLRQENPSSNAPPPTDHGDLGPIWYSFDLTHKRIQEGGWTHQVTQRELPTSRDLAGVNMRLTAGSFRELHWHTADEWAIMLYGTARVTILNPDGTIAAAMLTIRPGGVRELHWHPNASEWQYYIAGKGRMTVFAPVGLARTMDFKANDVGYLPPLAGHYTENTGDTDLVVLEMFKANEFVDVSLNNWIRHLPPELVASHLGLDANTAQAIPAEKLEFIAGSQK